MQRPKAGEGVLAEQIFSIMIIFPQGGDIDTAGASNRTAFNSTLNATLSQSYSEPESLPHPRNTRLFYEMMKSGSQDLVPMVGLLISCILARLLP